MRKTLVCSFVLAVLPLAALADEVTTGHMAVQPNELKWGPPPPGLPPGAKIAVVVGDPSKAEPYVIRAELPRGYKIMPHTHPTDENVTVLVGAAHVAMGGTFNRKRGETVRAGGFFIAKQGMQHYFWVTDPTLIQVHGMGPFAITYVNPTDDPRNKAGEKK